VRTFAAEIGEREIKAFTPETYLEFGAKMDMERRSHLLKITGIGFIFFAISANIPYWLLAQNFEYDDILRQPTEYVLTRFQAGGSGLILTWFAFSLCALLFVPMAALLQFTLSRRDTPYLSVATLMGMVSGVLQAIGLMRWVFCGSGISATVCRPKRQRSHSCSC
jgi:hypothetical protein